MIIEKILDNKLSEASDLIEFELKAKSYRKLSDKKGNFKGVEAPISMRDSSGNNDLCDSADKAPSSSAGVSEQSIYRINAQKRILDITHPHQSTEKIIKNRMRQELKLDKLSKIK